ncbi:hypothetical protein [Streptomyces hayashii]
MGWRIPAPGLGRCQSSKQALLHLQTAYGQIAEPVLDSLAHRAPTPQTKRRFAQHIQQAVPEYAEYILNDPAWVALATVLAQAEKTGINAATVLDQALGQRTLDDAHSPARTLTWRIRRLGERHAPSPRAQAANTCSTAQRSAIPAHPAMTVPLQQRSPARRR